MLKKVRFNSEKDFNQYYEENDLGGTICCWSHIKKPTHYPCILVWYHYDDGEEESIFGKFIYKEDLE
jgi:hypothetical protein